MLKAIDEFLALAYWNEKKLPTVVVRLFNTVGPRQTGRYGMVIPNFVLAGARRPSRSPSSATASNRVVSPTYATWWALSSRSSLTEGSVGEIFNVGNDHEITINALAAMVREMTESTSEIVHIPYDQAYADGFEDMRRRIPDLTKLRRFTGHAPSNGIREILRDVIESMRASVP